MKKTIVHSDYPFNDEQPSPWFSSAKSHEEGMQISYQAKSPRCPFKPFTIPAAIKPEKAPDKRDPEYKMAVLNPSSFRVYQEDR